MPMVRVSNGNSGDYAAWLIGKSVSFTYSAWWDGRGTGDSATVSGFIPLVGLDSVTVNAWWGGGVGSMEYSIYDMAGQKIGPTRYSGVATIALNGEAGQLRYTFRADPKPDPTNNVSCSITITNAS